MAIEIDEISTIIATIIAVASTIYGVLKYSENRNLKRQEIILPLMKEFDELEKYDIAKKILDSYRYGAIDNEGWNITEPSDYYSISSLEHILRDSRERRVTDRGEIEVRESFRNLLDFFGKLGYLLDINAISKRELGYFLYYIEKIYDNSAIIKFVKSHEYELFAILLSKLRIQIKEDKGIKELVNRYYKRNKHRFFR